MTQPTPDKELVMNINNGSWRAVVRPSRRQEGIKGAHGFPHGNPQRAKSRKQTTRERRKKHLNNSSSRRRKKRSQKTRERKRLWGVKTPWKWRVPRTRSRKRDKQRRNRLTPKGRDDNSRRNSDDNDRECSQQELKSDVCQNTDRQDNKDKGKSIRKKQEMLDANIIKHYSV